MSRSKFYTEQFKSFNLAEKERFEWQTQHLIIVEQERKLLAPLKKAIAVYGPLSRVLEVGCGEGANLANLGFNRAGVFGVDYAPEKIQFCATQLPCVKFFVGDAKQLSFSDESYHVVFARDVLHHLYDVSEMETVVSEMYRVLKRGGTLISIEPNARYNLILRLFGIVDRTERNAKFFCPSFMRQLFQEYGDVAIEVREPSMLSKALFHYKYGFPSIAHYRPVKWLWKYWKGLMRFTPKWSWGYVVAIARK